MDHPFRHCSDCGATDLTQHSEREFHCPACGFRHFVTPIPAACAILLDSKNRLLVIRRAHEPGIGKLGLPGGVIEGGETAETACSREVHEEVGLTVAPEAFSYVTSLPNRYLFQGFVWPTVDLFYKANLTSFEGVLPAASEVSEWMALPLAEVPLEEFAFHSNAEAVRIIRQRLGH